MADANVAMPVALRPRMLLDLSPGSAVARATQRTAATAGTSRQVPAPDFLRVFDMRRWIMAAGLFTAITGCAGGALQQPPAMSDLTNTATVVVIRPRGFVNAARTAEITFDGYTVGRLGTGHNMSFLVPTGTHTVSVITSSLALNFERGQCYYFRVAYSTGAMTAGLERMRPDAVHSEAAGTSPVSPPLPDCPVE